MFMRQGRQPESMGRTCVRVRRQAGVGLCLYDIDRTEMIYILNARYYIRYPFPSPEIESENELGMKIFWRPIKSIAQSSR